MSIIKTIKGILGYCQSEGCKNKSDYSVDIKFGNKTVIRHLCETCSMKLINGGTLKSVTYQQTVDFDEE